jgi:hypothetical protein
MQPQQDSRAHGEVLDPTEARQANPRKMNFRVLLASMVLAVAVGIVLVAGFWQMTPNRMDASSGGNPSQNTQTQPPAQNPSTP